ncbi:MAG: hypothetical protein AB7D29_06680 [Campylobacterales bacterium]
MVNKFLLVSIFTLSIILSGCSPKSHLPTGSYVDAQTEHGESIIVITNFMERGFFSTSAGYLNDVIMYPLQVAAEDTIARGYSYFSIAKPEAISNINGLMINSAPEYADKCANNSILKSLVVLTNPCTVAIGDLKFPYGANLTIYMYKTPPQNHLAYDAKQVLLDLKAKDMYYDKPRFKGFGEWNKDGKLKFLDLEAKKN